MMTSTIIISISVTPDCGFLRSLAMTRLLAAGAYKC
jgi:hypothetical protein